MLGVIKYMSTNAQEDFLFNVKREIKQKIKTENKDLEELNKEKEELESAVKGYSNYYDELEKFIIESMQDFSQNEEDLPSYFRSNINEVYQNYVHIKHDAKEEIDTLTRYMDDCKRKQNSTKRTLKFYRSQYLDSDFFEECLPLVALYQEKIDLYEENYKLTQQTIKELEKIFKKLENWK